MDKKIWAILTNLTTISGILCICPNRDFKYLVLYLLVSCSLLAGCGYQVGDILPERTIAVPIFHNATLYRGYELSLTRVVISDLLTTTPLRVVSQSDADTVLYGTIHKIQQFTISKDESRQAIELDVVVETQIRWVKKDGTEILPARMISETMHVQVQQGQTVANAIGNSLHKLSRKIVANLEHPYWEKNTPTSGQPETSF